MLAASADSGPEAPNSKLDAKDGGQKQGLCAPTTLPDPMHDPCSTFFPGSLACYRDESLWAWGSTR